MLLSQGLYTVNCAQVEFAFKLNNCLLSGRPKQSLPFFIFGCFWAHISWIFSKSNIFLQSQLIWLKQNWLIFIHWENRLLHYIVFFLYLFAIDKVHDSSITEISLQHVTGVSPRWRLSPLASQDPEFRIGSGESQKFCFKACQSGMIKVVLTCFPFTLTPIDCQ